MHTMVQILGNAKLSVELAVTAGSRAAKKEGGKAARWVVGGNLQREVHKVIWIKNVGYNKYRAPNARQLPRSKTVSGQRPALNWVWVSAPFSIGLCIRRYRLTLAK